jgi:uncharacterized membrane protein YeaQ/YmgE (transglycosylase-associated protein family)
MNLPTLGRFVDERFLDHRLRSTSFAGIVGAFVSGSLWAYRYYVDHVWSSDLFTVLLAIVVAKLALMAWYALTD